MTETNPPPEPGGGDERESHDARLVLPDQAADRLSVIDHTAIDWDRVERATFVLSERFRYLYPGPIRDLHQRLIVFPPQIHGHQRVISRHLQVSAPSASIREQSDHFGNRVCLLHQPRIDGSVEFDIRYVVEWVRHFDGFADRELSHRCYREASALTEPDERLRAVAESIWSDGPVESAAERICSWVHDHLRYEKNITSVETTAAQALALGAGVCQDHAHVMLAICRLLDIPARYVSGHLMGDGASHAWVEVIQESGRGPRRLTAVAFDPSSGKRCRLDYITVAVGRDYADVPPTSGTFVAPYGGRLTTSRSASVSEVQLRSD